MISHALHLSIFEQPSPIDFFNTLLKQFQIEMTEDNHDEGNTVITLSARMGERAGVRWH